MTVRTFLERAGVSYQFAIPKTKPHEYSPGELPFITISRQSWAHGLELAADILKILPEKSTDEAFRDFKIYDRALCEKIAEDPELVTSLNYLLSEDFRDGLTDSLMEGFAGKSSQIKVYRRLFRTIKELAAVGRCIVIGRAGSCLTQEYSGGVHVRLVADEKDRIANMVGAFKVTAAEAKKRIKKQDKDKGTMVRTYFRRDINDPLLYDVVWNTSKVPLDVVARHIVDLTEERFNNRNKQVGADSGSVQ